MKLEIFNFKDKTPKRGKIVCFSEEHAEAEFYFLDGTGLAWGCIHGEWEYACPFDELQEYGSYSHWARAGKAFNITVDIPKE